MLALLLQRAIRAAGIPVVSVSIGDDQDRATWRVHPAELQGAAQPVINAFVRPTPAQLDDERAEAVMGDKALQAVALALWECIPAPTMTRVQLKRRVVEIYKTL